MRFFELTHSEYPTDHESARRNPVRVAVRYRLPGIACDNCGPWSSSDRLRVSVPEQVLREFDGIRFLSVQDWLGHRDEWASMLGVSAERLSPGAELGEPRGEVLGTLKEDFIHPSPGEIWVTERVADSLRAAAFRGMDLVKVALTSRDVRATPQLWEVVPTGRAWRRGTQEKSLMECDLCGREGFPRPKVLSVDPERWDGTDFFHVDRNPNIVLVTERVRDLLVGAGFSNVELNEV